MHMKYCYLLFFSVCSSLLSAQVQMPGMTQQALQELNVGMRRSEKPDMKHIRANYPVYPIQGKDYLSMVAKVENGFEETDLPNDVIMGTQIGQVVTLKVPLHNLNSIQFAKNIQYVEVAPRIQPTITKAVLDMRADSVQQGLGLDSKFTGKDVIIGVTDWGFDYTNPMFYDTALQETRILASWDQFKTSGPAPSGMTYGAVYEGVTELMNAQSDTACTYYDYATHGNHVAGIAGGGGAGIGLKGPAFDAEFLFCAIHLDGGAVIDAVSWMKDVAEDEGKRLVINMSWGLYHLGPLDGTSLLSQALDNYSDQGVVIVTSGGNNGDVDFHIKKDFNQDSVVTRVEFYDYNAHASMWGQSISMWGEPNTPFEAGFEVRSGSQVVMETPIYSTTTAAAYLDSMMIFGTDTVFFNLAVDDAHPENQRSHMRLRVKNESNTLRVVLKAYADNGTVHFWNVTELENGAGNWGMPFSSIAGSNAVGDTQYGIGEPACTKKIITVAAHASENRLPNGAVLNGNLAGFSSEGPTMDERIKPDVSAPGVGVESSINSFTTRSYTTSQSTTFNGRTYDFSKFSGTSMASPAAAGVVALMLEANPNLSPAQVKEILMNTARQDNRTGVIQGNGSPEWGRGKVTANAAVAEAYRLVSIAENSTSNEIFAYPNPAQDQMTIFGVGEGKNMQASIYSVDGRLVAQKTVTNRIDVSDLAPGAYILQLKNDKDVVVMKFLKE